MRIVDVGCGFGGTMASLNERFSDLELVGVNLDARQLERAAELVKPCNGNTIKLIEADAAQIPLADNSFDRVLAVECAFHFDRRSFFAEARRLLAKRGNLTISDFVASERSLEYMSLIDFSSHQGILRSYGDVDLTCSMNRYCKLAEESEFALSESVDITENTLPTYDFLFSSTMLSPAWPNRELFSQATKLLEKAARYGVLQYKILRFAPIETQAQISKAAR